MSWLQQHEPRIEAIVEEIPRDARSVLSVGAAPYLLAGKTVRRAPNAEHYGINLGDGARYSEAVGGQELRIRECNIETDRWPFESDSAQVIVMGAILEHLLDPMPALDEARRVCAPDGKIVLSTPNAVRLIQRARTLTGRNPFDGFGGSRYHRHNREWTRGELRDILAATGWAVDSITTVTLRRSGLLGRVYERVAGAVPAWDDQLVVAGRPTRTPTGRSAVYRRAVTEHSSRAARTAVADGGEES